MKLSRIAATCLICTTSILFANSTEEVTLDEVTITGGKIDRNLQDTVSSIQVFNEQLVLNNSNLSDMYSIFQQTSNVSRADRDSFTIRGINNKGVGSSHTGPKTINIELDGVSLGVDASKENAISTWDISQVEVFKGPQSTVQGRNSLAGAVVLKTNDPEFDANGAAQLSVGTHNKQVSIMQTGKVTDNLALRISADKKNLDGFVNNNKLDDNKFNSTEVLNLRAKLLYLLDNDASAKLTINKLQYLEDGDSRVSKDKQSTWNTRGYYNTDAMNYSLEIQFPITDKWSFTSVSSYEEEDLSRRIDNDGFDGNVLADVYRDRDTQSQEFRFNYIGSSSKSIIGLYHSQGKSENDTTIDDIDGSSVFNGLLLDYVQNGKDNYTNSAIFFNTDYYLNDQLTLILGARWDKDRREDDVALSTTRSNDLGAFNGAVDLGIASAGLSGSNDGTNETTNFIPKIGLNYKINDNINAGFTYSEGYRPGGRGTNPISGETKEYDTENTENIELSLRSLWLDKRLTINANVFYTKWKDQQVSEQGDTTSVFDVYTTNAGQSTLKGIEIDTQYSVNNEVNIYGSLGYIKAQFDEYKDDGANTPYDYSGNDLEHTPTVTANIGANFRNNLGYFVGGNVSYIGSSYEDSANTQKINSFQIVNVKVGYEQKQWAVYVYANNLFDKNYVVNNYGDDEYEFGDPRVLGFNLKFFW
jgi:outer membrane receptor protein involved in Fe transport